MESMINEFFINYETQFNEIEQQVINSAKRLEEVMVISRKAIREFNDFENNLSFSGPAEQIYFFKIIKPRFFAMLIYQEEKAYLENNKPNDTIEAVLIYYQKELEAISRFFNRHRFYYEYYRYGMTALDEQYFVFGENISSPALGYSIDGPTGPITLHYLISKFIGFEKLQHHLVTLSQNPDVNTNSIEIHHTEKIKWTGDVINLVELTYGLWLTGQINHGNASLNQIVRWLEANLAVSIGSIQKRFSEIERRKRLSPTRFIDQMKEFIQRKIDKDNE